MDKYLIDGHKLYWHLDRVLEWQANKIVPPVYVEISPVSFCNHKCIFCGVDFTRDKGLKLDTEVLSKRLKEMGGSGVRSIMFAGEGEPLLHENLSGLVKVARGAGIDVALTTNGTLGNYDVWKEILPHLTWIRFSVDAGTAEVHAKVHNVSINVFDKTIKSIEDAVRVKNDFGLDLTIGVQFLIIDENIGDIENAISLFAELRVDYLSLKPYSLHPQMVKKRDTVYSEEEVRQIDEIVDKFRRKSKLNIIFRKEALKKYIDKKKMFRHCHALPFWGYISSNGDFFTCSVFIGDERFRAGNIYESDMKQILFGDKRRTSIVYGKETLLVEEECRLNCRMARINEFLEMIENRPEHENFI